MKGSLKLEFAAALLLSSVILAGLGQCSGCKHAPPLSPIQLAVNAGYDAELVRCKETGKASGSFAVYEACERAASRRICLEHPEIRPHWARCAEVLP